MRTAIYCRVSTDLQEREGTSLETQLKDCIKYCQDKGYEIIYEFSETYSGLTLDRPKIDELRELVRGGQLDNIVVHCIDRLSRDPTHGVILTQELERYKVALETVTEDTNNSELGKLITYIRGFSAKLEAEKIKERTKRGRKARLARGKLIFGRGCKLFGYSYDSTKGKRNICEKEADIIRDIFEWYVNEGLPIHAICYRLISRGIKTPLGNDNWCHATIYSILKNKAYIGITESRNGIIEGATPAIITPELFEQAQERLSINRELASRNLKRDYLLRGHIYCSICGRRYSGATKTYKDTEYKWYRCSSQHHVKTLHCANKYWKENILDDMVWHEIEAILSNPELVAVGIKELQKESGKAKLLTRELEGIQAQIDHYQKRKDRIWEGYLYTGDDEKFQTEIKNVQSELDLLGKREVELENRIEAIRTTEVDTEGIKRACEILRRNAGDLSLEGKKLALQALNIRVWINQDKVTLEGDLPIASIPSIGTGSECHLSSPASQHNRGKARHWFAGDHAWGRAEA